MPGRAQTPKVGVDAIFKNQGVKNQGVKIQDVKSENDPMTAEMNQRAALMQAGSLAVRYNSPMGDSRANAIGNFVAATGRSALDIGCGTGALSTHLAENQNQQRVTGVDSSSAAIDHARKQAAERLDQSVIDRLSFEVADGASWTEPADTLICIGSSHIFGNTQAMLGELAKRKPKGAVIGDAFWRSTPSTDLKDMFGDLPEGLERLTRLATSAGWTVAEQSESTIEEWDTFEHGWTDGVRSLQTTAAIEFAQQRSEAYQTYRGVLGFGWLFLLR